MMRKFSLILSLLASVCWSALFSNAALSQSAGQSKLTVSNIGLSSTGDGYYNANVNLMLQRSNNAQVNFGVFFQHVKSLEEIYGKLRPAVDDLPDELKHAEIVIPH